ncbi:hypothetical protein ACTXT7_008842 [Hymenolepis weldensis]
MSDFNCRIVMDAHTKYEGVIGPSTDHSPETSVNGQRIATFCANNGLKILNIYYEKKKVLRSMWHHLHGAKAMMDLVMGSSSPSFKYTDTRVSRKAEANSNHSLVATTLRVKACSRRIIFHPNRELQAWQFSRKTQSEPEESRGKEKGMV